MALNMRRRVRVGSRQSASWRRAESRQSREKSHTRIAYSHYASTAQYVIN